MTPRRAVFVCLVPALALMQTRCFGADPSSARSGFPALVVLVRHAEKARQPANDPPLSSAGEERARALKAALAEAGITAIVTTEYRRTRDTAQPLAEAQHITPEIVRVFEHDLADHVRDVVAALRKHPGEGVLVVGHTNTIPAIIRALGGPRLPDIADADYGNLFVLVPREGEVRLVRGRYGDNASR